MSPSVSSNDTVVSALAQADATGRPARRDRRPQCRPHAPWCAPTCPQPAPASAHSVRYSLRGWCDHQKCLTLCLWHALLITGVPDMKLHSKLVMLTTLGPGDAGCGAGGAGWKWHGLGHDPEFVKASSAHPNMLSVVEALLGGPVRRPRRNRGCYSVFPRSDGGAGMRLGPHNDGAPTELMAVMNLTEVGPRAGGFTIWPTSPQVMHGL